MFKFDQVALPQRLIRKALVIVDFQQDFVGANASLPITLPEGFADRTVRLAKAFRRIGDVVWVNSRFEEVRAPYGEHMEDWTPGRSDSNGPIASSDAFLSHEKAKCTLSSKIGAEVPQIVKDDAQKTDIFLLKSHYSAFEGTGLLRLLRARMTMEVYVCGSLVNAGVYATTVDAAGHGLTITLCNDCCGYSSETRQIKAIEALRALTGCEVSTSAEIVEDGQRNLKQPGVHSSRMHASHDNNIAQSMRALSLNATTPVAAETGAIEDGPGGAVLMSEHESTLTRASTSPGDNIRNNISRLSPMNGKSNLSGSQHEGQQLRGLCEGDTDVIEDLLPPELEDGIFGVLSKEVQWQRMSHQGGEVPRLVAVQGEVGSDGSIPIYRHPSDESPPLLPFSQTVMAIKAVTERQLGHPLNHVLIQLYRDGKDYISEHSDKTLDIVRGSYIANVSLGAKRTMVLRTKRVDKDPSTDEQPVSGTGRKVQRAPLPHNSLCRMGLKTNMKWLHSIRQDKRADREKSPEELAYEGSRISLTFRRIGTFLKQDETKIWGQGATAKTLDDAENVINGQTEESIKMLRAFGTENHASNFDWDAHYGKGFDVLHLRSAPRLFSSTDSVINMRISMMLAEYEIGYATGSITHSKKSTTRPINNKHSDAEEVLIKYVDNDDDKTEVSGDLAIMLYLYANYQKNKSEMTPGELAKQFTLFQKSLSLLKTWREVIGTIEDDKTLIIVLKGELLPWESGTSGADYIGGSRPGLADFALWPVLYSMVERCGKEVLIELEGLESYYDMMRTRPCTVKILDKLQKTQ
ncbi:isochorismatase family protein family [Cordyceps militaris CM01]|uniref:Isochorismatase family protein family n=1 Tax=Cordyceps militaris (strain CM01) TaxID=983644 RepID=G3J5V1_CORMM|nr:isochorismatase family protein family [Cordyceps militaris CM01]EGX96108.1 isochorismatase family protein family [Cordyceps militaris CM01]